MMQQQAKEQQVNNGNGNETKFGVMLRQWRAIKNRTLRDVALEIGIGHSTLARIEKGEAFDVDTWLKLQNWMFKRSSDSFNREVKE